MLKTDVFVWLTVNWISFHINWMVSQNRYFSETLIIIKDVETKTKISKEVWLKYFGNFKSFDAVLICHK